MHGCSGQYPLAVIDAIVHQQQACASAICSPRYGSSPAPSMMRPYRASRAISTVEENAQLTPAARASRAAIDCTLCSSNGSQEDASARGIGLMVRKS